jgi:uncharacterized protein (DUF433 family)
MPQTVSKPPPRRRVAADRSPKHAARLFRGRDPREVPMYTVAEASHHLHVPSATLRSWVVGRDYRAGGAVRRSRPLIHLPDTADGRLSFTNLVEAHVLRALRAQHQVPMKHVRRALDYAERKCRIDRLLIRPELRAAAGEIFLSEYGRLLNLSRAGQLAMEMILEKFLRRLDRDVAGLPVRLYPFPGVEDSASDKRIVTIDPLVSYGRPAIARKGISTAILAERVNAGEDLKDLAYYYDLSEEEIGEALVYEFPRAA